MTEEIKPHKFRSLQEWESSVDQTLREAMERGDFDNLPGKGKPLDLDQNPFTPPEWQLAFKMLQDAGYTPDWIELDKDIRKMLANLQVTLDRHARWEKAQRGRIQNLAPPKQQAELEYVAMIRARLLSQYRERAGELNKIIDVFNLKAPASRVHHPRIRIDQVITTFERNLE